MIRSLTNLEVQLLRPVFKETLQYESIRCTKNEANIGGADNSITVAGVPHFSTLVYCEDFSTAVPEYQRHFVHEITHVWQWAHGVYPVYAAIGTVLQTGAYPYSYDLTPGKKLSEFYLEQQASIVADYWGLVTKMLLPQYNNKKQATLSDYSSVIDQLQKSGTPAPKFAQTPGW